MTYIATFYSHYGAISFKRDCEEQGIEAVLMPVPRDLSSSCGTCVRYEADRLYPESNHPEDMEQLVKVIEAGYEQIYRAIGS